MKCQSCQKEKEEYLNEMCKECSDKMDGFVKMKFKKVIKKVIFEPIIVLTIGRMTQNRVEESIDPNYKFKRQAGY